MSSTKYKHFVTKEKEWASGSLCHTVHLSAAFSSIDIPTICYSPHPLINLWGAALTYYITIRPRLLNFGGWLLFLSTSNIISQLSSLLVQR